METNLFYRPDRVTQHPQGGRDRPRMQHRRAAWLMFGTNKKRGTYVPCRFYMSRKQKSLFIFQFRAKGQHHCGKAGSSSDEFGNRFG